MDTLERLMKKYEEIERANDRLFNRLMERDKSLCEEINDLKNENDELENTISRLRNPNNNNVVKLRLV